MALRLQRLEDMQVTLVDRGEPGSGTTGASFAWVNANRKLPRAYFELNVAGMKEHDELERELEDSGWLHRSGNLEFAVEEETARELRDRVDRLQSWGYEARLMEAEEAVELEPQAVRTVFPEGMGAIAYFPGESWVEAAALARLLVLAARRHGAQLRFGDGLAGIEISGGGVRGISLKSGERLEADAVVNACGPGAAEVADMVGSPLGLDLRSGLLVSVAVGEVPVSHMLHTDRVNLRPDSTGGLLLHHESVDRMLEDGAASEGELAKLLLERAREALPVLRQARVYDWRVGTRPIPQDGLPCLGPVPAVPGYYEAVTHSGVTLGPLLGRLLAEEISSGEPHRGLCAFRPYRFRQS